MVLPVIAAAFAPVIASLIAERLQNTYNNRENITSAYNANMYSNLLQHDLYKKQYEAYNNLDIGYRKHLASEGRSINPNRAWTDYFGSAQRNLVNYQTAGYNAQALTSNYHSSLIANENSMLSGAGGLFGSIGKTSRYL